jgi:hypothetical protein
MTELLIRPEELVDPVSPEAVADAPHFEGLVLDGTQQYGTGISPRDIPLESRLASTSIEVDERRAFDDAFLREALELEPDRTIFSLRIRPNGKELYDQVLVFSEGQVVGVADGSESSAATGLLEQFPKGRMILPPAAADLTLDYDLVEIANEVVSEDNSTSTEGKEAHTLPPFLSPTDAIAATAVLSDSKIAAKLTQKYGSDTYDNAIKKAVAMREANIAETYTMAKDVVRQYNRLRQGAEPDDTIPIIFPDRLSLVADSVTEPALHEVDNESLVFNPDEGQVMLSALHLAAFRRSNNPNQIAALEVLSRYEPSEALRKFFGNLLHQFVDIRPEIVKNAPEYPHSRSKPA